MLNVILKRDDSIERVLPMLELAMQIGAECRVRNVNYLGLFDLTALSLLAKSGRLMDAASGQVVCCRPGFRLLGLDDRGVARMRVN